MKAKQTRANSLKQSNRRLISIFLALILAICLITISACCKPAAAPKLYIGDKWVYKQIQGNTTYIRTETVTGEERIQGKDCYIVEVSFAPPFDSWIPGWTEWSDKATYSTVREQFSTVNPSIGNETFNRVVEYSKQVTGSEWPYKIGNEFTIEESWTRTDVIGDSNVPQKGGNITTFKVTAIEEIEIGSGNIACFKTVAYQEGNATFEYWYSAKAKAYVKHVTLDNGFTDELVSYSVR